MNSHHLIFNSFPRSGNVFMTTVASQMLEVSMISSVHIPEIYQVKELLTVAIFRKPEDCIASLIYKQLQNSKSSFVFDVPSIRYCAEKIFVDYQKYSSYATQYADNINIVNFENLKNDPVSEVKKVANRFGLNYFFGKQNLTIEDIYFENDKLWKDSHDGHMPREKNETRLKIESLVSSLDFIKRANDMHNKIIGFAT
jgi:hypothetical protein